VIRIHQFSLLHNSTAPSISAEELQCLFESGLQCSSRNLPPSASQGRSIQCCTIPHVTKAATVVPLHDRFSVFPRSQRSGGFTEEYCLL
jgi:hypothetical protein